MNPTLNNLITDVIDSADDTGCTDDLIVVSREALIQLAQAILHESQYPEWMKSF